MTAVEYLLSPTTTITTTTTPTPADPSLPHEPSGGTEWDDEKADEGDAEGYDDHDGGDDEEEDGEEDGLPPPPPLSEPPPPTTPHLGKKKPNKKGLVLTRAGPCPCGSGLKYKRCCRKKDKVKEFTAKVRGTASVNRIAIMETQEPNQMVSIGVVEDKLRAIVL